MNLKICQYPQWLIWHADQEGRKRPYSCLNKPSASTWTRDYVSFDAAALAAARFRTTPAFCFTRSDPFIGIDVDDCLTSAGELKTWADPIVQAFGATYGEISPSGRGIKFYGIGEIPDSCRKVYQISDGQVEIYCHGRFFCFTGNHWAPSTPDVESIQPVIDWFIGCYTQHQTAVTYDPLPRGAVNIPNFASSPQLVRMRRYIEAADRPAPGARNSTAFRIAGALWSIVDEFGQPPEMDQVMEAIVTWNASLSSPLEVNELVRVVNNARVAGTQPSPKFPITRLEVADGWDQGIDYGTVHERGQASPADTVVYGDLPGSSVVISSAMPQSPEDEGIAIDDRVRYEVEPLPSDLLDVPGFVGDVVGWNLATAMYPQPELALAGALALQSVLASRKIRSDLLGTRPGLYLCSLAPSGAGKDHARRVNRAIIEDAGLTSTLLGPDRIVSGPGILAALQSQPSTLVQVDEFGKFLSSCSDPRAPHYLQSVATALLELHSSDQGPYKCTGYANVERNSVIQQPGLCIHATSTPLTFWRGVTLDALSDGLLARFSLFFGRYVDFQPSALDRYGAGLAPPSGVVEIAKWWADHWSRHGIEHGGGAESDPHPRILTSESGVHQQFERFCASEARKLQQAERRGDRSASCYARVAERAMRLAVVRACSASRGEVLRKADLEWGIALAETLIGRLVRAMGEDFTEGGHQDRTRSVLDLIRSSRGAGISKAALTRKTQYLDRRMRDLILADLVESGQVRVYDVQQDRKTADGTSRGVVVVRTFFAVRAEE